MLKRCFELTSHKRACLRHISLVES